MSRFNLAWQADTTDEMDPRGGRNLPFHLL